MGQCEFADQSVARLQSCTVLAGHAVSTETKSVCAALSRNTPVAAEFCDSDKTGRGEAEKDRRSEGNGA